MEDYEHAALTLDGIFADCYSRWGGRFSLIVPCVKQRISAAYWPWLESYDPDLIYTYVTLSEVDILEIHERLGPAKIYSYRPGQEPRLDVFGFKPDYRFTPLASLSGIFRLARHRRGENLPIRILDHWHTERPTRFLTDNFGTYQQSQATGMYPADATTAADRLIIVSSEHYADRKYGVPRDLVMIPNELEAVRAIGEGRATCMSMLSAQLVPRLEIHHGRWSSNFNLVIGDSFADRVLFWNARLLVPAWLDTNICCLRITLDQLADADFFAALVSLLNRYNHVNGGGGGQPQLAVRSCSLNGEQLDAIAKRLQSARVWSAIWTEAVQSPDALIPDARALEHAREGSRFTGEFLYNPGWIAISWESPTVRPPVDAPDHLADAPPQQFFTTGYWASDFILEHNGPGPRMGDNPWVLPRRWRMSGAFQVSRVSEPFHADVPSARASRDGRLTVFTSSRHAIASITVPSPRSAFHYALAVDGRHATALREHDEIIPPAKAARLEAANEDRYLTGVLGMAGGLGSATEFLLHPFLTREFENLGGVPNPTNHDTERTDNRLRKLVGRQAPYDMRIAADRNSLGNLIVRAARELKHPKAYRSYAAIKDAWNIYLAAVREANSHQGGAPEDRALLELLEEESLDACLIALRRRQMLFQGHRWICDRCSHQNWQDFGDLSAELICAVCKQASQAPVDIEWQFRPNEFLIECLRDHSTLSLIWLLQTLVERARTSLIYIGPTWFRFSPNAENPECESDLLALVDGRAFLCEAKSSWRDVRSVELERFANLALRLRPDVAMLAVMEAGDGPIERIGEIRGKLAGAKIVFEVQTRNPGANYDAFLPSDN